MLCHLLLLSVSAINAAGMDGRPTREPLSDAILFARQGWGELRVNTATNAPGKKGRRLQIGDQFFDQGVGTHAPSTILVPLEGRYTSFHAKVGVQAQPTEQPGSVIFRVSVDGEERFNSGVLRQHDAAVPVEIDLRINTEELGEEIRQVQKDQLGNGWLRTVYTKIAEETKDENEQGQGERAGAPEEAEAAPEDEGRKAEGSQDEEMKAEADSQQRLVWYEIGTLVP